MSDGVELRDGERVVCNCGASMSERDKRQPGKGVTTYSVVCHSCGGTGRVDERDHQSVPVRPSFECSGAASIVDGGVDE